MISRRDALKGATALTIAVAMPGALLAQPAMPETIYWMGADKLFAFDGSWRVISMDEKAEKHVADIMNSLTTYTPG